MFGCIKIYKHWPCTELTLANIILNSTSDDLDILQKVISLISLFVVVVVYLFKIYLLWEMKKQQALDVQGPYNENKKQV